MTSKRVVIFVMLAISSIALSAGGRGAATVPVEPGAEPAGSMVVSTDTGISAPGGLDILSFSTGLTTPVTVDSARGGIYSGKPGHDAFVVHRIADKFSPIFYKYAHTGLPIQKISITVQNHLNNVEPVLWTLQNAYVDKYAHDWTGAPGTLPSELLRFTYRKICQRAPATGTPFTQMCYDQVQGRLTAS